jgi:hypothetical protein
MSLTGSRFSSDAAPGPFQAPAHIIVPDDGQQAAMQDAGLFAKHPPDNKQRLDQQGHIGKVRDELLDARLKLNRPHYAHLKAEVAQGGTQVVLDGDGLRLSRLRWVSSIRSF